MIMCKKKGGFMKYRIKAANIDLSGRCIGVEINTPSFCPNCSGNYNPNILEAYYFDSPNGLPFKLFVFYFCTACDEMFFVRYDASVNDYKTCGTEISMHPSPGLKRAFTDNISSLSNRFVKIYNEAYLAEQMSLSEISGIGYRKAFEFLIKDYSIRFNEADAETIKKMPLNQCITKYIDNKHINLLAKASTWIGNDEAHYARKHEDYDINQLKSFINATVSFIDSELEYHKATSLISSK